MLSTIFNFFYFKEFKMIKESSRKNVTVFKDDRTKDDVTVLKLFILIVMEFHTII